MTVIEQIKSTILTVLPLSLIDVIDIALLAALICILTQFLRETRAMGLIKGIFFLLVIYLVSKILEMKALTFILDNCFSVGIIAIVILFQPELRRSLEKAAHIKLNDILYSFGINSSFGINPNDEAAKKWTKSIKVICEACEYLSAESTGALIVMERETKLGEQIDTGTIIDASPSKELIGNIFYEGAPLHDGAIIIRDGMIHAAGCFLPRPSRDEDINKALGARHRAAIGMSENSDAVVIIVSEETGVISLAEYGELTRGFSKDTLFKTLSDKILNSAVIKQASQKDAPHAVPSEAPSSKPKSRLSGVGNSIAKRLRALVNDKNDKDKS